MYFEGMVDIIFENRAVGGGSIYYRIFDTFDYTKNQPLGSWKRDVFKCEKPNVGFGIANKYFSPLLEKLDANKTPEREHFNVITKYYKIDGLWLIDYSMNDLGGKHAEIRKE